jgi:hypothetical protein
LPSAEWYFTSPVIPFVARRATKGIKKLPQAKTAFDLSEHIPKEDIYA